MISPAMASSKTDEELDEFLQFSYTARLADIACTMEPVVLDTDVASLSLKGKLPPDVLRLLCGRIPLITFVTHVP